MAEKQHIEKLPNAPLQEVVFELLWEMDYDNSGKPIDPEFEFAQGLFAGKIKKDFPLHKRTIPEGAPFSIYPKPIHQFWKGENQWPVVQLGPGILTVNDIEQNYTWKKYKRLVLDTVQLLNTVYTKKLRFIFISLKYIDAVETKGENVLGFINKNFNVDIKNRFQYDNEIVNLKINETFRIENVGNLDVLISSGFNQEQKPAVLWQSNIFFKHKFFEFDIQKWIEEAHNVVSNHFKEIVKDSFYANFTTTK